MVEELLNKLIKAETSILRAFFYYKTNSLEVAEYLYQDLIFKLLKSRNIKSADNPRAYLFRAAGNLVKDYYRRSASEREKMHHVKNETEHSYDELDAERILAARQKFEHVETALYELPQQCQNIFRLVKIEGKKQHVVANELGVSLRTVENNLRKALLHCQQRLKDKGLGK